MTSDEYMDSQMDRQNEVKTGENNTTRKSRPCKNWTPGTCAAMYKGRDAKKGKKSRDRAKQNV